MGAWAGHHDDAGPNWLLRGRGCSIANPLSCSQSLSCTERISRVRAIPVRAMTRPTSMMSTIPSPTVAMTRNRTPRPAAMPSAVVATAKAGRSGRRGVPNKG